MSATRPARRAPTGPAWLALAALVAAAPGPPAAAGSREPLPLALAVQVVYGDDSLGPESLRQDVERRVVREIGAEGCFAAVERHRDATGHAAVEAPAPLLLRIRLTDLEVRESWDMSLAERTSPNDSGTRDKETMVVATVGFDVRMDLLARPGDLPLRERDYRHEQSYRPLVREDPREAVRAMVIDDLARDARALVCKGAKRLPREIERARASAAD